MTTMKLTATTINAVKCEWKSLRKQEWQTYLWVMCPLCCCYIFYGVLCFSFQIKLVLVRQYIVKVFNCVHFDPDGWSPSFQKKFNQAFNEHIQLLIVLIAFLERDSNPQYHEQLKNQ